MSNFLAQGLPIIPNSLAIWGLGQLGLAIKGPDGLILIDPYLTDYCREQFGDACIRAFDPPIVPDQITDATHYLISHDHLDHYDPKTASALLKASPNVQVITTAWVRDEMASLNHPAPDQVIVPNVLEPISLSGTSARITLVPSAHYDLIYEEGRGHRWVGFIIEWNGVTFYHTGDTIIYDGYLDTLKKLPKPDVVMAAMNGRDAYRTQVGLIGNLLPDEAAQMAEELDWGLSLVGHNDLFRTNVIPMGQIADAFEKFAPRRRYKLLQPGELLYFVKQ